MIRSFKNRNLRDLFHTGSKRGIPTQFSKRITKQLDVLNRARELRDIALPGFNLHQLKGDRKGTWAIKVNGNWRLVFRFEDQNVYDLDLVDYH